MESNKCVKVVGNEIAARPNADSASNFYCVDTQARIASSGVVTGWRVFAKNTRSVELVIYRGAPGAMKVVGRSGIVQPDRGHNEFVLQTPIRVRAGDQVGWYTPGTGPIAFEKVSGPWNTGNLRSRVLFSWGKSTAFSGSGDRVYSIAAIVEEGATEVVISTVNYDGEGRREADEYVEITNRGLLEADISGWRLRAQGRKSEFVFPAGVTLATGQVIRVYTDLYEPFSGGFTYGSKSAIWNNKGGIAALIDLHGNYVNVYYYGNKSSKPRPGVTITLEIADSLEDVTGPTDAECVDFTVLQLNDVYDATPVEGGRRGGLARVATLRRQLEEENPNLLSVMIGDFLAPSAIGATTGDGGKHMVEALNTMQLTHATIGNHEFDVGEEDLLERIQESKFKWVISNVSNGPDKPFAGTKLNDFIEFKNDSGTCVKIALLGVCLPMVKKSWIHYDDVIESAKQQVKFFEGKADVVLAMTHLTIDGDKELGAAVPRLDILMGGHEHEAATAIVGDDATPIFKADSNARSACVHRFRFDSRTGVTKLFTTLQQIDASFEEEPATKAVVDKWQEITFNTLRAQGLDPTEIVGVATEVLDGREAEVRNRPTNLTKMITEAFFKEVPGADAVLFGAGQFRLDGKIPVGDVTYYDIVRIFPKNSRLTVLRMPGSVMKALLEIGANGVGTGAFMATVNVSRDNAGWKVGGEPIVDDQKYKVIFQEIPAAVLSYPPFPGSEIVLHTRDIRSIVSDLFRANVPAQDQDG